MFFKPEFILILAFTIVIDYYAGILIAQQTEKSRKRRYLIMSLIANIGILAVFKYYNFINGNITGLATLVGMKNPIPYLDMVLPIGLSFHTFQAMSYTIEVYRGKQQAERHFGIYSLYVMFYPQLVAGPIERPQNMLHQFHERHKFNYPDFASGMRLIGWGLFKKVVIADRLAGITDPIFTNPQQYSAVALLMGSIFFSFQIFCDFSGYSDIAIGTGRVMGFKLMRNFDRPYSAGSVDEFWKRWHISLSTWFKDYLYIPLGGNRVSVSRRYVNLVIVFMLSGLWHGANWTFIIWGALHSMFVVVGGITRDARNKITRVIGLDKIGWLNANIEKLTTFLLVSVAWVFFRANGVGKALSIFKRMGGIFTELAAIGKDGKLLAGKYLANVQVSTIMWSIVCIGFMETVHYVQGKGSINALISRQPLAVRWAVYYFFAFCILYFGVFEKREFIYFQF
jgi:D-alanyl-lipoteichoic acid acyltransferase DltB (MBOAT superfamily)